MAEAASVHKEEVVVMEQRKIEAYRFIESKVLLDIRQISARYLQPRTFFSFFSHKNRRTVEYIARLSYAFHNLPVFLENRNMDDFDENLFWLGIDELTKDFNDIMVTNYHVLFERYLEGEKVNILEH